MLWIYIFLCEQVVVNGYDHKLGVLLDCVLEKIVNFTVDEKRFEMLKDLYWRTLKNWEDEQPYSHSSYYMSYLLREVSLLLIINFNYK